MEVAKAHLSAHEMPEARRFLAQAREADPLRYDRRAAACLASAGFDLEAICRPPPMPKPGLMVRMFDGPQPLVSAQSLPFGDCRDVDEYARFRVMAPITAEEIEATDWDVLCKELLEGE